MIIIMVIAMLISAKCHLFRIRIAGNYPYDLKKNNLNINNNTVTHLNLKKTHKHSTIYNNFKNTKTSTEI